jgi:hypothetical protein
MYFQLFTLRKQLCSSLCRMSVIEENTQMQRLESKGNGTVLTAIINMVIKQKMLGNQTWVRHAITRYATHCVTATNIERSNQDIQSSK